MTNHALLDNVIHKDVKVITERSARYGDNVMSCPAYTFEFRNLQAHYPILFQQDAEGMFYPVALFGFQENENLYLDESGWKAGYVPAMIQREPFLIGFKDSADKGEKVRMLSIDMDHPRVSKETGEALFQPLGGRTPYLEQTANLLETIYMGINHTRLFMGALRENDLVETVNFEITLKDGSRNQLIGFHGVAEEKVQNLAGATLERFSKDGFLMPLFMTMASLANIQRLVDFKNASLN